MNVFLEILHASPALLICLSGMVGLMVGSFLNVVIYRLPIMMQRDWRRDCLAYLEMSDPEAAPTEPFNLTLPLSRCPVCQAPIRKAMESLDTQASNCMATPDFRLHFWVKNQTRRN